MDAEPQAASNLAAVAGSSMRTESLQPECAINCYFFGRVRRKRAIRH